MKFIHYRYTGQTLIFLIKPVIPRQKPLFHKLGRACKEKDIFLCSKMYMEIKGNGRGAEKGRDLEKEEGTQNYCSAHSAGAHLIL